MTDEKRTDAEPECLTYAVETPLSASYDTRTGILTLESSLDGDFGGRGTKLLRLDFSPDAVQGLVRVLRILEDDLAIAIGSDPGPTLQH